MSEPITPVEPVVESGTPAPDVKVTKEPEGKAEPTGRISDPSEFRVPDEFRLNDAGEERGWVSKVKSVEDVYKQVNNMEQLIGKKDVPFNYTDSTPQEIEAHHTKTRPAEKTEYDFLPEGTPDEYKGQIQDMFYKRGISKHIAKELHDDFNDIQGKILEANTSKEGFETILKESFGDNNFTKVSGEISNFIKANVNEADAKSLDGFTNDQLGVIYRMVNKFKTEYGADEGQLRIREGGGGKTEADLKTERTKIRDDIKALSKRPHSSKEKLDLTNQLAATYR